MYKFPMKMTLLAVVFALSGCHGGVTFGGLDFPVKAEHEIVGSDFDEAFQAAYRSIEECRLEIYSVDKEEGKIYARLSRSATSISNDSRSFSTDAADFKYQLKQIESGNLVFSLQSKSRGGGQKYIDQFMDAYKVRVEIVDQPIVKEQKERVISETKCSQTSYSEESNLRSSDFSLRIDGQTTITEIKTE